MAQCHCWDYWPYHIPVMLPPRSGTAYFGSPYLHIPVFCFFFGIWLNTNFENLSQFVLPVIPHVLLTIILIFVDINNNRSYFNSSSYISSFLYTIAWHNYSQELNFSMTFISLWYLLLVMVLFFSNISTSLSAIFCEIFICVSF